MCPVQTVTHVSGRSTAIFRVIALGAVILCIFRPSAISSRILRQRSIFLRENEAGLSGFAILDSNKVE